jgi:Ca2+-transporting ATPase
MKTWHTQSSEEIFQSLSSSEKGLTEPEAKARLETHGPNELRERKGKSALVMMGEQLSETMVLILIAAALISAFLGKGTETAAILAIVVLFAVLGFVQEYRAERAMAALKQLAVPVVRVRREGAVNEMSARDLVPGDMVLLEAGNAVPADARLVESASLRIQEAALTGESEAVEKHIDPIPEPELPLGDRRNMAYFGTSVTYGRGSAVVVATGMSTELGKIASLIQEVAPEQTPLQKRLDQVGKSLAAAGALAGLLVLLTGVLFGEPLTEMFLTAVSVAVAVVPEGLPAVVTITLALGAQRMLRRNALVRRLPAVETLGSVTVICSDKTGTLTENRMTVSVVDAAGERLNITETMRRHQPSVTDDECRLIQLEGLPKPLSLVLAAGALCNDAVLKPDARAGCFHALGDPTEGALVVAAAQAWMFKDALQAALPRIAELPFDSERKRMTTLHRVEHRNSLPEPLQVLPDRNHVSFTKGAVDSLLDVTTAVWTDGHPEPLTPEWRSRIQAANDELAKGGMRVLGVALRFLDSLPRDLSQDLERDLTFIGLVGLMDPPRAAVRPAVETCKRAGIRPVMITGDHPLTAAAIAHDLQMADSPEVVTGEALNRMTEGALEETVDRVSVYARVSPEDKLRIVTALQRRGQVVAMTGDGVNDSPALKKADIGVAMGITGTDVAKEAADIVLLDDNFATIVAAVEEGRVIFDNLLRFIKFSLGGNLGKVLVMLCAPLLGINVALRPLQLLWLNLLTDGLMGLGLGVEPAEADVMNRPPRRPGSPVLERPVSIQIAWVGGLIALLALGVGVMYFDPGNALDTTWQTMIFMTLGFTQVGNALGLRASGRSPLSPTSNPFMTVLTLMTIGLQLAVIYLPFMKEFFGLTPLPLQDLGISFGLGVLVFAIVRIEKGWLRKGAGQAKPV